MHSSDTFYHNIFFFEYSFILLGWNRMRYWWLNIYFFFRKTKQYTKHYVSTQNNLHYIYISTQKLLLDKNPHTLRTQSKHFLACASQIFNVYSFLINWACKKWLMVQPTFCLIQKHCYRHRIWCVSNKIYTTTPINIIHQLFITTTISSCTWGRAQVHLHLYKTVFLSWRIIGWHLLLVSMSQNLQRVTFIQIWLYKCLYDFEIINC